MTMNITTAAMSHARIKEMEDMCFSDFHKDVYGYRPRGTEWDSWVNMSTIAFNEALDKMFAKMEHDNKTREEQEAKALVVFKKKLSDAMRKNKCDWKKALDRLMLAEENELNVGIYLWNQQISNAKQREIENLYYAA